MESQSATALRAKRQRYERIVAARKNCELCAAHLVNASRIDGGAFDSDRVGPYSQWQGNLDAPLLVVAQDFADIGGFRKYKGWAGGDVRTNLNLRQLVGCAGFAIAQPEYERPDDVLFFTNAVLCMKSGARKGRQQYVPSQCFQNCSTFLKQTILLVAPRVVVTLGDRALRAIRHAFPGVSDAPLREVVGCASLLTPDTFLVPMYHPSPTVVNTHRSFDVMREDWRTLRSLFAPGTEGQVAL